MFSSISNTDNVIYSLEVIKRFEELKEKYDNLAQSAKYIHEHLEEGKLVGGQHANDDLENLIVSFNDAVKDFDDSDREEYDDLKELMDDGEGLPDWKYGCTLIHEDHFEDYARELAEETGAINKDATWPNDCIDWERAAQELKIDYTTIEFGDQTYYVR